MGNAKEDLISGASYWGKAEDQFKLGNHYFTGANDFQQDYTKAIEWYLRAANQGHAKAQFTLSYCYEFGDGVEQNQAEALYWYYAAFNNGDQEAKARIEELEEELPHPVIKQMKAKARRLHDN